MRGLAAATVVAAGLGGVALAGPSAEVPSAAGATVVAGAPTAAEVKSVTEARSRQAASRAGAERAAKLAAAKKATAKKAAAKKAAARKALLAKRKAAKARASRSAVRVSGGGARGIARAMLASQGMGSGQFGCLNRLWHKESNWRVRASNPSSSAYGIPQALPGSKMASAGPNWRTDARTQIRWGLRYIKDRYGSPCAALAHSRATGWY
jgi:hypothetical protein